MVVMEDEAYARRLFAILTNPHPTGVDPADPYGQADDRFDRYDGFGRDIWVESVAVAKGEHGSELLITFGLAVSSDPELLGVQQRGALRLAFDAENPDTLVMEGPYKYLRHPFYTSYLIFWVGWAIAIWSPWTLLPLAVLVSIYVVAAKGEEQKFSNSPLAAQYEAYRKRAGMFWPRLGV